MAAANKPGSFSAIVGTTVDASGTITGNRIAGLASAGGDPGAITSGVSATSGSFYLGSDATCRILRNGNAVFLNCLGVFQITLDYAGTQIQFQTNAASDWLVGKGGATAHIMDSTGTPTYTSGFGGSATITGNDYAFLIVPSDGTGGVVTFGHAFDNPPICSAQPIGAALTGQVGLTATTTTLTFDVTNTGGFSTGWMVLVRGF